MERKMKKWLSFMTAAAMVIAMASTGFAEFSKTDPNLSFFGGSGNANVGVASGNAALANKVSFDKVILVEEGGSEAVDEPEVSWKYTIRPVNDTGTEDKINTGLTPDVTASYKKGTTTISDGTNTLLVEPGTAAQLTAPTETKAEFKVGNTEVSGLAVPTGKKQSFTKTVSFNFNAAGFTKPGVYRFVIKEEKLTDGANTGDVEDVAGEEDDPDHPGTKIPAPYQPERFLDVYVRKNAAGTGYEIYGYVMHSGDTEKGSNEHGNKWKKHKNSGYDGGKQKGNGNLTPQGYTKYTVRKVKIRKQISGLIPTTTKFPFTLQLLHGGTTVATNNNKELQIKVKYPGSTPTAPSTVYTVKKVSEVNALIPELKDGEEIEIYGLPKSTTVKVNEQNKYFTGTITSEMQAYTSTDLDHGTTSGAVVKKALKYDSTGTSADSKSAEAGGSLAANDIGLNYHNHIDEITPTGVVLTVVPYAMMVLVAFSMAFMFLTKRKEE